MSIPRKLGRHLLPAVACLVGITLVTACATAQNDTKNSAVSMKGATTVIRDNKPLARIYIKESLVAPEVSAKDRRAMSRDQLEVLRDQEYLIAAVADFNEHLKLMTGTSLEVVTATNPSEVKPPAIVIGELAVQMGATPKFETTIKESYRLISGKDMLLIGGEGPAGFSHGLYTILYTLGCDWIMPGPEGLIAPKKSTLQIPVMDEAKKPDFVVRAPWYSGGGKITTKEDNEQFAQWKQRQRQSMPAIGGGRIHPLFMEGGHFWHSLIRANKKMLEEIPEMRALIRKPDGTFARGWAQLETAHPKVIDLTVEWVKEQYTTRGLEKTDTLALSIGPNDGGGYSISAEEMALSAMRNDPITGDVDMTDNLILYTNKVLEKLRPEYPNVYLGFYIYSVHSDYPQRYVPDPHFVGNFADITYSRYHSTLDPRSFTRTYYKGIVEQWGKLSKEQGNPLWFYGYNWNLAENLMPYSKLKIWGQDLPWHHENGIRGHNNEQDKAWSILGPHNYLMARMGWDLSLDWQAILKEYTVKTFGEGAPEMEAYYLDLIDTQEKKGHEAGSYHAIHLVFDRDFIKRSKKHFAKATALAKSDEHKRNVDYFGQSIDALEIYLDYNDAAAKFDFEEAQKQYVRMTEHFQTYLDKNANLVSRYGRRYLDWLFKPYIEQAVKYTTGDYQMVYAIPDALPTLVDPNIEGQAMGFFNPEKPDGDLIKTKTFSSTWDAQGLWPFRQGAVWYRIWFDADKLKTGEGMGTGLFLGAFEDMAHVWCNGQYVGNASGFMRPAAFDLTEFVKAGQKNLVAVQIIRRNKLNEANLGGIIYPSFIFSGPRLEKVAPNTQPMERILPGGSREAITE